MDKKFDQTTFEAKAEDAPASVPTFPSEPFACPACGQLLAPTCRVCVACKHTIDPAEFARPRAVVLPTQYEPRPEARPAPVRYPWRSFFVFFGILFLVALIFEARLGEQNAQLAMAAAQILAGIWVLFDALRQRVPRPLRWAIGSMLLPVVFFPWYWARRTKPRSPVPAIEAEVGPVTRFLLFAVLAFVLARLILYVAKGPPAARPSAPSFKEHNTSGGSVARFDEFRRSYERWAQAHAETSAPSDASQT